MAYNKRERNVGKLFEEFLKTLKAFEDEKKLTHAQLSRELGQDASYVTANLANIKKNKNPAMSFLEAVADYFDAGIVYKNGYYYMARLPEGVS
jgi:transcriptional regulator with XRE-family HTH domain